MPTQRCPEATRFELPKRVQQFVLDELIAEGGMGSVYRAHHVVLNRHVAVKFLAAKLVANSEAIVRFQREVRSLGQLNHPNIVEARDAGQFEGSHFLVMDYIPGVDLARLSETLGPLPAAEACELIRQAARGLEHIRRRKLVHRDMKPANLILTHNGIVKILDLGLALFHNDQRLTEAGVIVGTLDYLAPEQIDRPHEVDIRSDIYCLGATFYQLLCGKSPLEAAGCRNAVERVTTLARGDIPPLATQVAGLPAGIPEIIARMMAFDRTRRLERPGYVATALASLARTANVIELVKRFHEASSATSPTAGQESTAAGSEIPSTTR